MELDTLELVGGQVLARKCGGVWDYSPRAAAEGPGPEAATLPTRDTGAAPSLSLSHNCNGEGVDGTPKPCPKGKRARRMETLALNVEAAVRTWGLERVVFYTQTFRENLQGDNPAHWKRAKYLLHKFGVRVLSKLFRGGVVVWEVSPKGRIHAHVLAGCHGDVRTGVDSAAMDRGDYRTATPELRRLWAILREKCPVYGLGRHEVREVKDKTATARYVGGYLGEDLGTNLNRRVRQVSYFGERVRDAYSQASWRVRYVEGQRSAMGNRINAVGLSATFTAEELNESRKAGIIGTSNPTFRTMMRDLEYQGMTRGHTVEVLRAKLGRGWAWRLVVAFEEHQRACERDASIGKLPSSCVRDAAASQVVRCARLDTAIDEAGQWLESWVMRDSGDAVEVTSLPGEVQTLLREFSGCLLNAADVVLPLVNVASDQRERFAQVKPTAGTLAARP